MQNESACVEAKLCVSCRKEERIKHTHRLTHKWHPEKKMAGFLSGHVVMGMLVITE